MKNRITKLMMVMLILVISINLCACNKYKTSEILPDGKSVTVMFTHDIHSKLDNMARLKTLVDEKKKAENAYVLVDGGDVAMGTLYQTLFEKYAPEYILMGMVGYDATTFGNHEFDYRPQGLANMLNAAVKHSELERISLPQLVVSNIDWNKNTTEDNQLVKAAMDNIGSKEYIVVEREGVRIGIFGVLGEVAAEDAPMSGIEFDDIIETSKRVVDKLKEEKVDMIICLSHSGTEDDVKKSEDELLAKAVPEIDVIISGHSHTLLEKPIVYGDTTIVSHGCYLESLGELTLKQTENGRWAYMDYNICKLDDSIEEDEQIKEKLNEYKKIVSNEYLNKFGYTYDQVIVYNAFDFDTVDDLYDKKGESTLGNIISDAFMYAVYEAEGEDYIPIAMTIEPVGVIRDTFKKGNITVSDVFNVSSLGIGEDKVTGYPLAQVYLTGAELLSIAEIDVSVSDLMSAAKLHVSGASFVYNSKRMFLNRATEVKLFDTKNGVVTSYEGGQNIEKDKLYRVVSGLYSLQMLGAVKDKSFGLISIVPKDKDGNPIDDFSKCIIHDKDGKEIKEWVAIAWYLESFDKKDGVPNIPETYANLQGRKADKNSINPVELFKNPNKIALAIYVIIIVLIVLVIVLIRYIVKLVKYVTGKYKKTIKRTQIPKENTYQNG